MTIKTRIQEDTKSAMKSGNKDLVAVLRFLTSAIRKKEIDDKIDLDDASVIKIIQTQIKQRKDSVSEFEKGGRTDLVDKENNEIVMLTAYLPKQLTEDEIAKVVDETVTALGATSQKDMGKVMKEVSAKLAGVAEGKAISEAVKKRLS